MNTPVVSGLLLLALLGLVLVWRRKRRQQRLCYERQETLFSTAEQSLLTVLDLAVGDQARIFAKVRVADVLTPAATLGKRHWQQHLDQIRGQHFDYLLCHPADLSFICAIALDDSAHRHQKRKAPDLWLQAACASAGLPLLQIPASTSYLVEELREQILPLLVNLSEPLTDALLPGERREPTFNPLLLEGVDVEMGHGCSAPLSGPLGGAAPLANSAAQGKGSAGLSVTPGPGTPHKEDVLLEASLCPRCDAPLMAREAKKGPHAGQQFLACSRFPDCRYAAPRHD